MKSLARTPVVLVGGNAARRFATWGDAEASGLVSVPNPESSVAGALAVTAPEAEARAVGRTRDAARQLLVPFAQAQSARTVEGEDATVQPAMFARRSPRLVVATEQQLETVDGRADLRDLTPAVGAPVSTSRSWSPPTPHRDRVPWRGRWPSTSRARWGAR